MPTAHATAKIADCPREGCGGYIFMGRKGYGCSNYRSGCRFVIWKQSLGKTLSAPMVRSLIEKGRTSKLKLADEAGQSGTGTIILLDASTGKLGLEWAD
jgi:DNA topoisomerase-3